MFSKSRPCDSKNRKKNRYTRKELEDLMFAAKEPLSKAVIKKMNMNELCAYLKLADKKKANPINCMERSLIPLRDYQKRVVRYLKKVDRFLVYHKMGTGKTMTAVTASQCYLDEHPASRVIVVAPASLLDNFRNGMMQYGNLRRQDQYDFYSIQKCTKLLKEGALDCKNKMVIVDEVHNYKADVRANKAGKITSGKNILQGYKCFLKAKKLLLLTGTPIYNRPIDLNLYKVLLRFDPSTMKDMSILEIVKHFKEEPLDILRCSLSYYDYEKSDADFPKRIEKTLNIPMRPEYEARYKKILAELEEKDQKDLLPVIFKGYKESNENQFLNITRRATQNIDNNVKLNAKLDYVKDMVEKYQKKNSKLPPHDRYKMVIYSQFKDHGIHLIQNIISVPYGTISGTTKVSERAQIVRNFNEGNLTVLFITKAGGEGLDLKGTDAILLMEPTWNDNSSEQVIARAIRFKSHAGRAKNRQKVQVLRLCHVAKEDTTKASDTFVKDYLRVEVDEVPKLKDLSENLISCDLIVETFQKAKQKVLNLFDRELQKLSIEANPDQCRI